MYKRTFFQQIFLAILMILTIASVSFILITYFQSQRTTRVYNERRLLQNEERVKTSIGYAIGYSLENVSQENLKRIVSPKLYELVETSNLETRLYDLDGNLLFDSNKIINESKPIQAKIKPEILQKIRSLTNGESTVYKTIKGQYSSFININDSKGEKIGIIEIPFVNENKFLEDERNRVMLITCIAVSILFLGILIFAYFSSKAITNRIEKIAKTIKETDINSSNQLIDYQNNDEFSEIVISYNKMVGKLKDSTELLAKYEREEAWKNMARQVAHEIKNPLTPMRLSIQSFQLKFKPTDVDAQGKVDNLCSSLIQQIDSLNNITSAFANFAQMPIRNDEPINAVEVIQKTLAIYNNAQVHFSSSNSVIQVMMDKSQLARIVTNLVKNALQSTVKGQKSNIQVSLSLGKNQVILIVKDNGTGIPKAIQEKIFEPQFTTKTSGMGLGLAMVRKIIDDYNGSIELQSELGNGSTFIIRLPI